MRSRRASDLTRLEYGVGLFFVMALLTLGALFFMITGPIKPYEMRELGGAYTFVLRDIEDGARDLRADYCAKASAEALDEATCNVAGATTS